MRGVSHQQRQPTRTPSITLPLDDGGLNRLAHHVFSGAFRACSCWVLREDARVGRVAGV